VIIVPPCRCLVTRILFLTLPAIACVHIQSLLFAMFFRCLKSEKFSFRKFIPVFEEYPSDAYVPRRCLASPHRLPFCNVCIAMSEFSCQSRNFVWPLVERYLFQSPTVLFYGSRSLPVPAEHFPVLPTTPSLSPLPSPCAPLLPEDNTPCFPPTTATFPKKLPSPTSHLKLGSCPPLVT